MHHIRKAFFVVLGCISLALGTIGIALPILPTVPFYLLTAFCFANSSQRLHDWFVHTTVYKKYIGSYFRRHGRSIGRVNTKRGAAAAAPLLRLRHIFTGTAGILR